MDGKIPYGNPAALDSKAAEWWPEDEEDSSKVKSRSVSFLDTQPVSTQAEESRSPFDAANLEGVENAETWPKVPQDEEAMCEGEEPFEENANPFLFRDHYAGINATASQLEARRAQTMWFEHSKTPKVETPKVEQPSVEAAIQDVLDSGETEQRVPTPPPKIRNIDDCIQDFLEVPKHDLIRLDCHNGDTWIFIKAPGREPEYTDVMYRAICDYYKIPLRAHSSILEATQSELILKQLKNPTQQYRIIRRFGVKNDMEKQGIRYVLDLTPPVEGDDAVELTLELSCPPPILDWFSESCAFSVSNNMVAGAEEFAPIPLKSAKDDSQARPDVSSLGPTATHDYTPLRHRAAIERVLLAIHGYNPCLDSAPKMYTTVMAAVKHLKIPAYCLASNLTDYVVTWLRAVPNNVFIELYPDITLKVADSLEVTHLCQDAFAILVGEHALRLTSQHNILLSRQDDRSIHDRPTGPVDEIWETRLQYARNAFTDRISNLVFDKLLGNKMEWVEQLPCIATIEKRRDEQYALMYGDWVQRLKDYVKGAIYVVLAGHYAQLPAAKDWTEGDKQTATKMTSVFGVLTYKERIFTRNFWLSLGRIRLEDDPEAFNTAVQSGPGSKFTTRSPQYQALLTAGAFKEVTGRSILRRAWEMRGAGASNVDPTVSTFIRNYTLGTSNDRDSPRKRPRSSQNPGRTESLTIREAEFTSPLHSHVGGSDKAAANVDINEGIIAETIAEMKKRRLFPWSRVEHDVSAFEFKDFCQEVMIFLSQLSLIVLQQPNLESLDQGQIDLLLCVRDSELKYLPLWAGGQDDGTGGVFNEEAPVIPESEGFGPARDGLRKRLDSEEIDFDGASTTLGAPTLATSRMVNDGHSVIMDRRQVYADDEVESTRFRSGAASEAGTDDSWVEAGRDDVSVSTTSELANEFSRAELGSSAAQSDFESVGPSEFKPMEEAFANNDSDSESALDLDSNHEFDFEDASEGSDYGLADSSKLSESPSGGTSRKRKGKEYDEDVATWLSNHSADEGEVIKYKEPPQSPLTFDRD